jgi:hypothetical protein
MSSTLHPRWACGARRDGLRLPQFMLAVVEKTLCTIALVAQARNEFQTHYHVIFLQISESLGPISYSESTTKAFNAT